MGTFLDFLISSVGAAAKQGSGHLAPPAAVLWPDGDREWESVVPLLRVELPVLTLGDYDPTTLTGPAIWIRCMLPRSLPEAADWPRTLCQLSTCGLQPLRACEPSKSVPTN